MLPARWPEFFQFCGFITGLITLIQLSFNCFDLVLLTKWYSIINVRWHLIAIPRERDCCVEIKTTLLQLRCAPGRIRCVCGSGYLRGGRIARIRIMSICDCDLLWRLRRAAEQSGRKR